MSPEPAVSTAASGPAPGPEPWCPTGGSSEAQPWARAAALEALAVRADAHEIHARSARTRVAYAGDWTHFTGWCELAGLESLPAEVDTVRLYLTDLDATVDEAGRWAYAPSTLARRLAAIAAVHRDAGEASPTHDPRVARVLTGIRRARKHQPHRMRPLGLDDVRVLLAGMELAHWPTGLSAARDAFVLLAAFAGARRRSELAALHVADLRFHPADGLHLHIRESKTDQEAHGAVVALPYGRHPQTCPPCAALRWLRILHAAEQGRPTLMREVFAAAPWAEQTHLYPHPDSTDQTDSTDQADGADDCDGASETGAGPAATSTGAAMATTPPRHAWRAPVPELPGEKALFPAIRRGGHLADTAVTGDALHAMLQRRAAAAGLPGPIGFHSARAGFVTQARRNGADHRSVRRQTGHSSDAMVELYDRDHTPLAGNAVTTLGL